MKMSLILKLIRFWPPYLGAGVRVKKFSSDFTSIDVEMKLRFWNRNYVQCHFGGSLYSMADPFLMLMLIENLGENYIVWDKSAQIEFRKPGKGTVHLKVKLDSERINQIRADADLNYKTEPEFNLFLLDNQGAVIAEIRKVLYVRRKDKVR